MSAEWSRDKALWKDSFIHIHCLIAVLTELATAQPITVQLGYGLMSEKHGIHTVSRQSSNSIDSSNQVGAPERHF